jgi:phage portal protein BeeE
VFRFFFAPSSSGKQVTEKNAMQSAAVYACVRVIAETVASLPLHLYRHVEEGKRRDTLHPLYFLLHDSPNPEMTSFIFR